MKKKLLDLIMIKLKTIVMVLTLTMFSVQMVFAAEIKGTVSNCSLCHDFNTGKTVVRLTGDKTKTVRTRVDGKFKFTGIKKGFYTVTPYVPRHNSILRFDPENISVTVDGLSRTGVDFSAVCSPFTECTPGSECGVEDDGCGGTIDCGTCGAGEDTCEENVCMPPVCSPFTECTPGSECGVEDDGCGGMIDCGTCGAGESCVENFCELVSDTDSDGISDNEDNCPQNPNASQEDTDSDGEGDVCDDDTIYGMINGVQAGATVRIVRFDCSGVFEESTAITNSEGFYSLGDLEYGRHLVVPDNRGDSDQGYYWVNIPHKSFRAYDFM